MAEVFYSTNFETVARVEQAPAAIHSPTRQVLIPDAQVTPNGDARRRFVNDAGNSRASATLRPGQWSIAWTAEWSDQVVPKVLLHSGERTLGYGSSRWELLDDGGRNIAKGLRGFGEVVIDPELGWFLHVDIDSRVVARKLADGKTVSEVRTDYGYGFERAWMEARGNALLMVSIQRNMTPRGGPDPNFAVVERYEWNAGASPDKARSTASLVRKATKLLAAAHGDLLVLATSNALFIADSNLQLKSEWTGEFEPLALSVDEWLNSYMTVELPDGHCALWVVSREGELRWSYPLASRLRVPPAVGYNHNVYLAEGGVTCLDQKGRLRWHGGPGGSLAGFVIAANGELVTAAGHEIRAWDAEGKYRVLFRSEDLFTAGPVLTAAGNLLVASAERCYLLGAK